MDPSHDRQPSPVEELATALESPDSSIRLKAAMLAGTYPEPTVLGHLIDRCRVEGDFYVREMLTWALIQHARPSVIPLLRTELSSGVPQARSQALHTLSKLVVPESWPWVFPHLLEDADDEVARAAWRVAVAIVPRGSESDLLAILIDQLGRGDLEVKKSLARALVELEIIHPPVTATLRDTVGTSTREAGAHAQATIKLINDPGASFPALLAEASRI
ncbi:HEAT repeat domain-containing protein [Nigerium massiliense]|uniref:HEAT repeat domain-containing protein n=1 Tax=Nigerium massiliense TaxID=1522317 RepID=UPI000590AABB|nr:hypothetical protein [Nigerium massiliense]